MSAGSTGDAAPTSAAPAAAGSTNSNTNCASGRNCRVSLSLFYSCLACLGLVLGSPWLSPPPVLLQMVLYTAPILYIGSHLSLKQNEVDAITGERLNKGEAMDRTDAMLFPVFGSIALFSLYLAYKFLGAGWVNMLLTFYLTGVGLLALGGTIFSVSRPLCPAWLYDDSWLVLRPRGPFLWVRKWLSGPTPSEATRMEHEEHQEEQQEKQQKKQQGQETKLAVDWSWRFSPLWLASHLLALAICILWLITKHWALHNILAIAFCTQAIAIVSVGSFGVASILLCGLFVYDVFWVFGTEVMVSVAKAFEGPAKLMFPVQLSPLQYSILGLGDVVIPGVLIAMCLRFDLFLYQKQQNAATKALAVDIHQRFPKFYFCVVLAFYELGLLTTGLVMLYAQHPQPALLYLVPYCLFSLFGAAALNGKVKEVLAYKEEDEEGSSILRASALETTEKKEN
ncbi:signal peptide peptidase domain-containing protein, putative [Eimeria tenella]|uniref:Signal peptide peptidase domain-containing protein, putative n=1 Tax=Eimeria tenella TaxID=5802 RepID=U6KZJ4_EIMTE|nr:signal peptide peptidase domain-containing protein, putative [Eimeria tenella]CDJ43582.1 signal peptide peptidase domain-containing protein, putative [Eimeria tenella]|eukprot:XP_013234332.1 signal peptide peptidase domain-containing protein, putative [Eimeria tenella]